MSILITSILSLFTILISKLLFKKWFNHLSIFVFSWAFFIILYEVRLIRYVEINSETWLIIFISFIGFISGVMTIFAARSLMRRPSLEYNRTQVQSILFKDNFKILKYLIILCSIVGLASAIQHWYVLINKFGSIQMVLIRANLIYRMRVAGEIEGTVPYLYSLAYAGVFLGGINSALKNKFTFLSSLPIVAVILKDVASVGRGGIFVAFLLFIISFMLMRHLTFSNKETGLKWQNKKLVFSGVIVFAVILFSLAAVKEIRGSFENYKGQTRELNKLKDFPIISPSIYLYMSSNIGVLSKYFEKQVESPMIGENTFLPIYNLLSKIDVVEHPDFYPRGYQIPIWSNSATYLRDIHADFGFAGLFFIPYLLAFITTLFWFRFYEKGDMLSFLILVYLQLIIAFSVFYLITRAAFWLISFLFLLVTIYILENKSYKKYKEIS